MADDDVLGREQVRDPDGLSEVAGSPLNSLWTHMIQAMSNQVRNGIGEGQLGPLSDVLSGMGGGGGESETELVQPGPDRSNSPSTSLPGATPAPGGGTGSSPGAPQEPFSGVIPDLLGPVEPGKDGVPAGLQPNAARGAAAARRVLGFDGTIGGLGERANASDHPHGNAIDLMAQGDTGWEYAEWYRANREQFAATYIIFDGFIASPRSDWEWRPYSHPTGRTDPTAMHEDHVHVSFQGGQPAAASTPAADATLTSGASAVLPEAGQPWQGAIEAASTAAGIDPTLLGALVEAESGFDPDVVSHAGAIGLAQLMPGTARALGVDPRDPMQNLLGGARYLKEQLDRFGSVDLALAAYNAGPGRVMQAGNKVPDITETKNYVSKVMAAWTSRRGADPEFVTPSSSGRPGPRPSPTDRPTTSPRRESGQQQASRTPGREHLRRPAPAQQGGTPAPAPAPKKPEPHVSPTDRPEPRKPSRPTSGGNARMR